MNDDKIKTNEELNKEFKQLFIDACLEFFNNHVLTSDSMDFDLSKMYDYLKNKEVVPYLPTAFKAKDICGVSYYRKYGDKYTFYTNGNFEDLEFTSYEDYQEFVMCLVYLIAESRKKFEESNKKKMIKESSSIT